MESLVLFNKVLVTLYKSIKWRNFSACVDRVIISKFGEAYGVSTSYTINPSYDNCGSFMNEQPIYLQCPINRFPHINILVFLFCLGGRVFIFCTQIYYNNRLWPITILNMKQGCMVFEGIIIASMY